MIPLDRPVLGKDLDAVREQLGILAGDACWLFGLSMTKWMHIVRQKPDTPVKDPSLALYVRFLDQYPEASLIPKTPDSHTMLSLITEIEEMPSRSFSVLFGAEGSAVYRWLRTGDRQSPPVRRLMLGMQTVLRNAPKKQRAEMLKAWIGTVRSEGTARGEVDVFKSGTWNIKGVAAESAKIEAEIPKDAAPVRKKGRAATKNKQSSAD